VRDVGTRFGVNRQLRAADGREPGIARQTLDLGKALRLALPISMESNWRWRWLDTFDWYTPTYQWKYLYPEVYRWFRDTGFEDVQLFDGPIRMSAKKSQVMEPISDRNRLGHELVAS